MDIGLSNLGVIPHLFYFVKYGLVVLLVIKIIDDLLMAGENTIVTDFLESFTKTIKLGTFVGAPGKMNFNGISTTQVDEFSYTIHSGGNFNYI